MCTLCNKHVFLNIYRCLHGTRRRKVFLLLGRGEEGKGGMGRTGCWSQKCFTDGKCQYCDAVVKCGNGTRLRQHLAVCEKAPEDVRKKAGAEKNTGVKRPEPGPAPEAPQAKQARLPTVSTVGAKKMLAARIFFIDPLPHCFFRKMTGYNGLIQEIRYLNVNIFLAPPVSPQSRRLRRSLALGLDFSTHQQHHSTTASTASLLKRYSVGPPLSRTNSGGGQ